jgi:hypothetical protein
MQTRHVWGEVRQLRADASAGANRAKVGFAQDFGSWCGTHSSALSRTAVAGACPCDVANEASQVLGVFLFLGEDGLE